MVYRARERSTKGGALDRIGDAFGAAAHDEGVGAESGDLAHRAVEV